MISAASSARAVRAGTPAAERQRGPGASSARRAHAKSSSELRPDRRLAQSAAGTRRVRAPARPIRAPTRASSAGDAAGARRADRLGGRAIARQSSDRTRPAPDRRCGSAAERSRAVPPRVGVLVALASWPASRRSCVQLVRLGRRPRVGEFRALTKELAQRHVVAPARRSATSVSSAARPRPPEVVEHDLAALTIEVDRAAGRQEREVVVDLVDASAAASMIARRRSSKRNSRRCWPIRSMTVRWLLPSARRRPRPSCCVNTVADAVGRSSKRQSTSGTSTPSPRTSTEKMQRSLPACRS